MSGLVLKNVNKIYPGGQQSVKDFSLEIRDREFLILVGPAGCGKSALLRMRSAPVPFSLMERI